MFHLTLGAVQYRLEGPDATFFNVSASGSDAELALTLQRPLDRERKARLSFTLVATDGGHPRNNASLPVIIGKAHIQYTGLGPSISLSYSYR